MSKTRLTTRRDALRTLYTLVQVGVIQYQVYGHVYFTSYSHLLAMPVAWSGRSQLSSIPGETPSYDCRSFFLTYSSCLLSKLVSTDSVLWSSKVSRQELAVTFLVHSTSMSHPLLDAHVFRRKHLLSQVTTHISGKGMSNQPMAQVFLLSEFRPLKYCSWKIYIIMYVSHWCNIVLICVECDETNVNVKGILLLYILLYFKLLTNIIIRSSSNMNFPQHYRYSFLYSYVGWCILMYTC